VDSPLLHVNCAQLDSHLYTIYTLGQMPQPTAGVVRTHRSTSSQEAGVGMLMHLTRDTFWCTRPEFQHVAPHQIAKKRSDVGGDEGQGSLVSVVSAHTVRALYQYWSFQVTDSTF